MPLPRLLLPLCGLLLVLAVTAATAAAPVYGPGEVSILYERDTSKKARDTAISYCTSHGGSLVPVATEAVHTLVTNVLNDVGAVTSFTFMGGSTMMSSWKCTTEEVSLDCIWYWDEGRYAGVQNVVAFYRGNRNSADLYGSGMMTTAVKDHWLVWSSTKRCPCNKLQRYGGIVRDKGAEPVWSDTQSGYYTYGSAYGRTWYFMCAIDVTITTTTPVPSNGVANLPLVSSVPVAVALAVMAVVAWL